MEDLGEQVGRKLACAVGSDLPTSTAPPADSTDRVRSIRNDVMHFDSDGVLSTDLERLREFAGFLQRLTALGVV